MKRILTISLLLAIFMISSCEKNLYLPPDWNYDIPETPITSDIQLGAIYHNYTDISWKSEHYVPLLNQVVEDGEVIGELPYTSTQDGVLTRQCEWAAEAGIDFLVFPYNASSGDIALLDAFEFYYEPGVTGVDVALNYNFSHLKITELAGEGEGFNAVVADFKALYQNIFSKPWYFRLPDGRPLIIISGMNNESYDYSLFVPAFRKAMKEFTAELQEADGNVSGNVMNFYIVGENTANWPAPQTNEKAARYLDANYTGKWYPSSYYERWTCFYPFTDIAWSNWRDYARNWGNDFVPCIYPEFYVNEKGARSIDRTEDNYRDFCNVAKRNLGSQNVVLINSWNDFTNETALEPTVEYAKKYMEITFSQFNRK